MAVLAHWWVLLLRWWHSHQTIALSIAGVSLAVLAAAVAAWGRHHKRRRYGCDVARQAVECMKAAIDAGVHFAGYGAFSADHSPARDAVHTAADQVTDKELRRLLEAVVRAHDHAKGAVQLAQPFDPEWQLRAPVHIAAAEIDPASPHRQLKALLGEALERIHFLERKAAAY